MTATAQTPAHYWTIAIRPNAKRGIFHRVDLALTWDQAVDLAQYVGKLLPAADVWYVPNATYDAAHPGHEDSYNVMVDTGKRIRIKDDGVLPFDTDPTTDDGATTVTAVEDGGYAGWRWITFADGCRDHVSVRMLAYRVNKGLWTMTDRVWVALLCGQFAPAVTA